MHTGTFLLGVLIWLDSQMNVKQSLAKISMERKKPADRHVDVPGLPIKSSSLTCSLPPCVFELLRPGYACRDSSHTRHVDGIYTVLLVE